MAGTKTYRIAVIGASGYTGADLVRLAVRHPNMEVAALAGKTHAGQPMASVFPHLGLAKLPDLVDSDDVDWSKIDAAFCGLPHATAHQIIAGLPKTLKVIDMSADFRLRDAAVYAKWYGGEHKAQDLLKQAVYGLTEHYASAIAKARIVACPGCYPTAALLALIPPVKDGAVEPGDIIIDAKSGVSGAGRSLKQNTLFSEAGEGLSPYGIASHRHAPEIEQELSLAAGSGVIVNFTPHLIPMSRGELVTCYLRLKGKTTADDVRELLSQRYAGTEFVRVLPKGAVPATQTVRGSNYCVIGVFADRVRGRVIVISALDNLVKGSAGQAIQNFNLMMGLPETAGLAQLPLFP